MLTQASFNSFDPALDPAELRSRAAAADKMNAGDFFAEVMAKLEEEPGVQANKTLPAEPEGGFAAGNIAEIWGHIIAKITTMSEGAENIWEIAARCEEHNDDAALPEEDADINYIGGLNNVAGLLARFWKKKELLGSIAAPELWLPDYKYVPESGEYGGISSGTAERIAENTSSPDPNGVSGGYDNNAASELAALFRKKKDIKPITEEI